MVKTPEKVSELVADRILVSVLYRSALATIVVSIGIALAFVHNKDSRIELPVGLLMIAIGLVIVVFALVKLVPMMRTGHALAWAWLSLGVIVVPPLVVLVINLLS
jgi:formate/nitrite transporter FocA (FNT family)